MRTLIARALLAATLTTVVATACGYDPQPDSGTLRCSPQGSCPDGYTCDGTLCVRGGAGGRGGSGGGGSGGSGAVDKFIGTWSFTAALSTRTRECTDGTNETTMPWDDFFTVARGAVAALSTEYYCPWNLDVNTAGTTTLIRAGGMCTKPDPNTPGTTFTWHGESFTLTTTNGTTGTLEASLPYDYTTTSGSGSCTMHFTGPVTKS